MSKCVEKDRMKVVKKMFMRNPISNKDCIIVNSIRKSYKDVHALMEGFSCNIACAENTTLLGRNGAGKTTLMNLITNNLFLDTGTITINGIDCGIPEARKGLRYLPDKLEIPHMFTATEMFKEYSLYSDGYSISDFKDIAEQFECLHLVDHYFSKKSKGQQRLLMLSIVLSGEPSLIILDEPLEGLDPMNIRKVRNRINVLKNCGCTILQSSHRIHEAERQGGRYLIIHDGRVCSEGDMADIKMLGRVQKEKYDESFSKMVSFVCEIDNYVLVEMKDLEEVRNSSIRDIMLPATLEDIYIASLEQR